MIGSIPILILVALVGLALGSMLAWIVASSRAQKASESALAVVKNDMMSEIAKRDASIKAFQTEEYQQREELAQLRVQTETLHELKLELKQALADKENLGRELVEARAVLDAERKQMPEKMALLQGAREELSDRFQALASSILDEKAKSFTEKSQSDLGQLLNPLKTQLEQFRSRVDEVYGQESNDRSALTLQVDRHDGVESTALRGCQQSDQGPERLIENARQLGRTDPGTHPRCFRPAQGHRIHGSGELLPRRRNAWPARRRASICPTTNTSSSTQRSPSRPTPSM